MVIDIGKKEIYDTWKPGSGPDNNEVLDICFGNDKIYAATETGVFSAGLSDQGLSYFGNWRRINTLPDPEVNIQLLYFQADRLYANKYDPFADGDSLFAIGQTAVLFSCLPGSLIISIDPGTEGFTVSSGLIGKLL